MEIEIEAKFLDIDVNILRATLKKNNAILIHEERLMRRKNFDYPNSHLEKVGGWIRIRDEGDKITLAYKQLTDRTLEGTKEMSIVVNDFDKACNLLLAIGMDSKSYQETKRERWELNGLKLLFKPWPWILLFVKLEVQKKKNQRGVGTPALLSIVTSTPLSSHR